MKTLYNQELKNYTTFKMGGIAEKVYFPENIDELVELSQREPEVLDYILGGGSNLLINDEKTFKKVLCLKEFNNNIEYNDDGTVYIGASIRLQKAIKDLNMHEYGGIEYLFSVPGLIGGAIYMNAGRGRKYNKSISDYIIRVDYIEDGIIHSIKKEKCDFKYRYSIFHEKKCIIIGALFNFDKIDKETSKSRINERLELCKNVQDMRYPNFGSVFCESNSFIMKLLKIFEFGDRNGIHFSNKTQNWILHSKKGNFIQTIELIDKTKKIHKIFGKECKLEVKIWK